jgi:hypothetical protein
MAPSKVLAMKKTILLLLVLYLFTCGQTPVHGVEEKINNLPTQPIKKPRAVDLKWGQKLLCDYVWRDGNTIFVVVHGKRIAVGYDPKEIDMERSFGTSPKAGSPKEIKRPSVVELYEKSAMEALVNQISGLYLGALAQHRAKLPPELFKALHRAGREAFEATKMRKRVLQVMKTNFDPDLTREVLGWLLSPFGQKITALESIQFSRKTLQDMEGFAKKLQSNPPTRTRVKLIRRLNAATGASEKNVEVALMILEQTATAMENAMRKEKRTDVEEMRRQLDLRRPQLEQNAEKSTETSLVYIYQTLTDKELEQYVNFSESETGTAYHKMAFEALMTAVSDAAEENAKAVSKILDDYMGEKGG